MTTPTEAPALSEDRLAAIRSVNRQQLQARSVPLSADTIKVLLDHIDTITAKTSAGEVALQKRQDFMRCEGYRECDIAACNCGSWHGGHASDRLREIADLVPHNGVLLKDAIKAALAAIASASSVRREALADFMKSGSIPDKCIDAACGMARDHEVHVTGAELREIISAAVRALSPPHAATGGAKT